MGIRAAGQFYNWRGDVRFFTPRCSLHPSIPMRASIQPPIDEMVVEPFALADNDPKTPTRVSAFLLLGAVFMFNGTLWCLFLAWFAGSVSQKVRGNPRAQLVLKRGTGALFIGLGAKLAVDR